MMAARIAQMGAVDEDRRPGRDEARMRAQRHAVGSAAALVGAVIVVEATIVSPRCPARASVRRYNPRLTGVGLWPARRC